MRRWLPVLDFRPILVAEVRDADGVRDDALGLAPAVDGAPLSRATCREFQLLSRVCQHGCARVVHTRYRNAVVVERRREISIRSSPLAVPLTMPVASVPDAK